MERTPERATEYRDSKNILSGTANRKIPGIQYKTKSSRTGKQSIEEKKTVTNFTFPMAHYWLQWLLIRTEKRPSFNGRM